MAFLDRIITGDEKWVCYSNVHRRKQWLDPGQKSLPDVKSELHSKKLMLCIWWDMQGVIYFEFLDMNQTITADVYCQQLQRLKKVLLQKRLALMNQKRIILLHDNGLPHVAKLTQQKVRQFGWEVFPHLPWSSDVAPSDYHLFLSLRNYSSNKYYEYEDSDELKSDVISFLESKPTTFYRRGIELLTT